MGYDVCFQLLDLRRVRDELVPALVSAADAPPASPFDELPDASDQWRAACAAVRSDDPGTACHAACAFAACWSAASLPYVYTRNFAVTYHPLRMYDELKDVDATDYVGPEEPLFKALVAWRPGLQGHFATHLSTNYSTGGLWLTPSTDAVREWWQRHATYREAGLYTSVVRAADKHGFAVYETTDVLGTGIEGGLDDGPARAELLAWPGLDGTGHEAWALSPDRWRVVLEFLAEYDEGDRKDLVFCAARLDPAVHPDLLARLRDALSVDESELDEIRQAHDLRPVGEWWRGATHVYWPNEGIAVLGAVEELEVGSMKMRFIHAQMGPRKLKLPIRETREPHAQLSAGGGPYQVVDPLRFAELVLSEASKGATVWNQPRTHRELVGALRSRDIEDAVELYRYLEAVERGGRPLGFGEQRTKVGLRRLLVSALSTCLGVDENEAERRLDEATEAGFA